MADKREVVSAFGWKFAERVSVQAANFVLTLILARLLTPEDYGLVALILVFTSIASTFVQGGFNTALIQKKDVTGTDYVSVLGFSFLVAAALYAALFFAAPAIARFYRMELIVPTLRVLALMLFPAAVNSVQVAHVTRDLRFKILGVCNVAAMLLAAVVGIAMAHFGFGAWALVAQQLVNQTAICVILLAATRWCPKGRFSGESVRRLIPFGSRVLGQNLLVQIFMNLRSLIIGRMYTSADLGYFNRGKSFPQAIMESVNGTVQTVLLPLYSREQEDPNRVLNMVRTTIRVTSFLIFPVVIGMACVAEPMVRLLLTEKWLPCVPFLQIFAIGYIFHPTQTSSAQAYKALGDSRTPLRIEIIRKLTELTLLLISMRFGVLAIALSTLVNGFVGMCVTFVPNVRRLGYRLGEQLADILPALAASAVMGAAVLLAGRLIGRIWLQLAVQVLVGAAVYVLLAWLTHMQAYEMIVRMVRRRGKEG